MADRRDAGESGLGDPDPLALIHAPRVITRARFGKVARIADFARCLVGLKLVPSPREDALPDVVVRCCVSRKVERLPASTTLTLE